MRKQPGLRDFLSSFLIGFIVSFFVFQPYLYMARADIGSSIGRMINESVNYAPPTFKEMGERGYVGFGSLSIRTPIGNLNVRPFSFTPPFVKKGCGAIDIAMGGFNFLGFDYLVQKLQQILQAAPAFAFQLALEVFVPQVSQVLSKINAIADMINNINFDACKASTTLVHAVAPSLHDMIFNSRTDEAAQKESKGSGGSFWDSLANAFNLPPLDEIKQKFSDLINSFSSYVSSNGKPSSNPISLLRNVGSFSVFRDRIALNNPEYAPPGTYLRFTGSDDYNLKTAFIGELGVRTVVDGSGNVINVDVDFRPSDNDNINDFITEVWSCVERSQDDMSMAVNNALAQGNISPINSLVINCSVQIPVDNNSSTISFDAGSTIVKPILSSLVNYYFSISRATPLDSTSAKWVNFIASIDSAIIRAIRVAALASDAGGGTSVVNYLGGIVSSSLVKAVTAYYVSKLVSEGCSEMQAILTTLPKELGQIVPAANTSDKDVNSKSLLDGIKNNVLSYRDNVIQICSVKTGLANQAVYEIKNEIYVKNSEGLIKLAENLEQKLVENLNSRGLGTLARYVRVEQ
jgi:putative effector of murein hydrolase LrgA (UPF0299 family)